MRFSSARSREDESEAAISEALGSIEAMDGQVDLAVLFLTASHRHAAAQMARRVHETFAPRVLLGCTCEGVIGADDEIEGAPGVSLLVGKMPSVRLTPFHVSAQTWSVWMQSPDALGGNVGAGPDTRGFIILGDPFTTPIEETITALDALDALGRGPTVGGMASGSFQPGGNALLLNREVYTEGMVGVTVSGPVRMETVVSQGCRPIGQRYLVTGAEQNVIRTLGGKPAIEVVHAMIQELPERDRALLTNGLFVGVAIDEYKAEFGRGDFLIRNLVGADNESGAIAMADRVRAGQTVQFHVRDASTADEDLRYLVMGQLEGQRPAGALLFSCNGRGTRMFPMPCHDVQTVLDILPGTPVAGFFAMGEIGPVGDKTYLHGHTASIALFKPEDKG
jgi:small ligand-binding sensory domain FIST